MNDESRRGNFWIYLLDKDYKNKVEHFGLKDSPIVEESFSFLVRTT